MKARSIISSKGQIVIPANLRKRYGLKEGTTVVFQEDRGRVVLAPSNQRGHLCPARLPPSPPAFMRDEPWRTPPG
jgi:AbrB family looped-hinge helix DNA binding protein